MMITIEILKAYIITNKEEEPFNMEQRWETANRT